MSPERELCLQIAVTNRCNLSCRHCYREVRQGFPDEWTTAQLITCLEQLAELARAEDRLPSVVLSGGEPLLREDLGLVVRVALSLGIEAHLNTNGTLLDPDMALALVGWGLGAVQISLDGPDAATHDAIRGRGAFVRAMQGVASARAAGLEVMAKVTLMPGRNLDKLAGFYALARAADIQVLSFARLIGIGPGARLQQLTMVEYRSALEAIARAAAATGVRTELRDAGFDRAFVRDVPHRFSSEEGRSFLALDADGTAYAGRRLPLVLGNARLSTLSTLWAHPLLVELRERRVTGKCASCELFPTCEGGARAAAYGATGDPLAPDPHCWYAPGQGDLLAGAMEEDGTWAPTTPSGSTSAMPRSSTSP